MARITFHTNDPVIIMVYSSEKCIDIFGKDYLEEYGREIPDELLKRYEDNWEEFIKIQDELEKIKEENKND